MRIPIDECLPKQLKGWLAGDHEAATVQDMGWANVGNGKLLRLAENAAFEVFATADKNIYHQQDFAGLRLSSIVIPSNRKRRVREIIRPGQKVVMDFEGNNPAWQSLRLDSIRQDADRIGHLFR